MFSLTLQWFVFVDPHSPLSVTIQCVLFKHPVTIKMNTNFSSLITINSAFVFLDFQHFYIDKRSLLGTCSYYFRLCFSPWPILSLTYPPESPCIIMRFVIPVVFYEITNVVCVCTSLTQLYIFDSYFYLQTLYEKMTR